MDEKYELIIIGGGPAGLSAAIYAGRAHRQTLLIEKGNYGGRINDTLEIRNYPGTISESGAGLMENFVTHAKSYDTNTFIRTTVTGVSHGDHGFIVHTKRKGDFYTESIILDTGTKPRVLGIPGERELIGHGVAYCATCDAEFFKGKNIYVLGAGDQAIEESCYLTQFANSVSIIVLHEEGHLDCNEMAAKQAFENPKIHFVWNSTLVQIQGEDHVEGLVFKNIVTGEESSVLADGVFFFVGMVPQTDIVKDIVKCDHQGYILVNDKKETNIPGLYAVGDCTQTFLRQVVTAAADGAIAATASERYIKEKHDFNEMFNANRVIFLFYNPYDNDEIKKVTKYDEKYQQDYQVYRIDITKQTLLYQQLNSPQTVALAMYENRKLIEKRENL